MKPAHLSLAGLLDVLGDIRDRVSSGDSFEGSIQYGFPDDDAPEGTDFQVMASYRTGNSAGQGGLRVIGSFEEEPRSSRSDWDPWDDVDVLCGWLNDANGLGEQEITLRILKLAEEVGEVAQARIGQVGQNPRKGVTHTADDVIGELCDVIVTAMVAVNSITANPVVSRGHLAAKFAGLRLRAEGSGS